MQFVMKQNRGYMLLSVRLQMQRSWQISLVNVIIGLLGTDGKLKSICLSGSIIAEDSTAENQSRAIISSFTESAQLLADWIQTTVEM